MGEVFPLFAKEADVDAAWEALRRHRERLLHDGVEALRDRSWVEQDARLDANFRRLLMAQEADA